MELTLWKENENFTEMGFFGNFFSGIAGARKMKNGSELCARLCENGRFTKKNEGTALDLPCNGMGSHKGESPLDPRRPPKTIVLCEKKILCFDKVVNI